MTDTHKPNLVDLVHSVGVPPEGIDLATHVIASVPPKELGQAARDSSFTYAGLEQLKHERPEDFKRVMDTPHPEPALAQEIVLRQQELSKTKRHLATLATMAALGAGGYLFGHSIGATEIPHQTSKGPVVERVDDSTKVGLSIGGAAAALGGFASSFSFAGISMSGRFARKPAQRLVSKAKAK